MNIDKTKTPENRNNGRGKLNKLAYRDGYIHGQVDEHEIQKKNRIIRDNNSAAKGLLIGIGITAILGMLGAAIFLVTHANQNTTPPVETAPVPTSPQP